MIKILTELFDLKISSLKFKTVRYLSKVQNFEKILTVNLECFENQEQSSKFKGSLFTNSEISYKRYS